MTLTCDYNYYNKENFNINRPNYPNAQTKTQFSMSTVNAATDKNTLKKVIDSLREWKECIHTRANHSRRKLQACGDDSSRMILQFQDEKDRENKNNYIDLLNNITGYAQKIATGQKVEPEIVCNILYDSEARMQSVGLSRIKAGHLYISNLLSAPWNIRLYGAVQEEDSVKIVKQSGSSLMRGIYEFAQQRQLAEVRLSPLQDSLSFYQYIGMSINESEEGSFCFYQVTPEIPSPLQKSSKPVVHL